MPRLCTLDLATNHFSRKLPDYLSDCRELKILSLAKNELSGHIPKSFAKLTSIRVLTLSNKRFTGLYGALKMALEGGGE